MSFVFTVFDYFNKFHSDANFIFSSVRENPLCQKEKEKKKERKKNYKAKRNLIANRCATAAKSTKLSFFFEV